MTHFVIYLISRWRLHANNLKSIVVYLPIVYVLEHYQGHAYAYIKLINCEIYENRRFEISRWICHVRI